MTPVDQITVDKGRGDCMRAAIATLFDLELEQVPNFRLFPDNQWSTVLYYFVYALGYEYNGTGRPGDYIDSESGYAYAYVRSRTFPDTYHAVVINRSGFVVHDPNPNKAFRGVNVRATGELVGWYRIDRREPE